MILPCWYKHSSPSPFKPSYLRSPWIIGPSGGVVVVRSPSGVCGKAEIVGHGASGQ